MRFFQYILLAYLFFFLQACYLEEKLQRNNPYDQSFDKTLNCRADADCARVGFCVSGKCAQCKDSNDCAEQLACVAGRRHPPKIVARSRIEKM